MRKAVAILYFGILTLVSCKKHENFYVHDCPPFGIGSLPVSFVVLDKGGNNLITSDTTLISVINTVNGAEKQIPSSYISILRTTPRYDTTKASKYGRWSCAVNIVQYTAGQSSISNYKVYVRNKLCGALSYDYFYGNPNIKPCFQLNSIKFNGLPAKADSTVGVFYKFQNSSYTVYNNGSPPLYVFEMQ